MCGALSVANKTQVTGSQIEGNLVVSGSGADTLAVGNHITGVISGSIEINQYNTS